MSCTWVRAWAGIALLALAAGAARIHESPLGRGPEDVHGVYLRSPVTSGAWKRPRGRAQDTGSPVLIPFLVDRVRQRTRVTGRLWFVEWLRDGERLILDELRVTADRRELWKQPLEVELVGQLEFPRLAADLERLPTEWTHGRRRQNYFLHPGAQPVRGARAEERAAEWIPRWNELQPQVDRPGPRPDARLDFELDLAEIFPPPTQPGHRVRLRFELTGRQPGGQRATYFCERLIEWVGPRPELPQGALPAGFQTVAIDPLVHGVRSSTRAPLWPPLHCPSIDWPGAFSNEQLQPSLRALGLVPFPVLAPEAGTLAWKGEAQLGQEGDLLPWLEALAGGGPAVAFAGSDAHEEPFDAGATHVLTKSTSQAALFEALSAGRSFLSNGPALILEIRQPERTAQIGESIDLDPTEPAVLRLAGAFAGDGVRWQVFAGKSGSTREWELAAGELEPGQTEFELELPLPPAGDLVFEGWLRAYAVREAAARSAYTNAIRIRTNVATER